MLQQFLGLHAFIETTAQKVEREVLMGLRNSLELKEVAGRLLSIFFLLITVPLFWKGYPLLPMLMGAFFCILYFTHCTPKPPVPGFFSKLIKRLLSRVSRSTA